MRGKVRKDTPRKEMDLLTSHGSLFRILCRLYNSLCVSVRNAHEGNENFSAALEDKMLTFGKGNIYQRSYNIQLN